MTDQEQEHGPEGYSFTDSQFGFALAALGILAAVFGLAVVKLLGWV